MNYEQRDAYGNVKPHGKEYGMACDEEKEDGGSDEQMADGHGYIETLSSVM